ncbi:MAG TPA: metallophosphoesterase [Polyangiaceae bacterium]|nr:metallophosphoesterase [Polyangiaceae bacterium]
MTTIAQVTDLHLVEDDYRERPLSTRARLSYLSFGRPIIPSERRKRVADALAGARAADVDHLLVTGDLTEDGALTQFEVLAELLDESRIPSERVTIVPGNHDAYSDGATFELAMAGPLRAYAETSRTGTALPLRDVTIVPVSTAFHQSVLRSAGAIAPSELQTLASIASDRSFAGRPLVFAQHHPPGRHYMPMVHWIDGLVEHAKLSELFDRCPHLYVVHGHTHRAVDKAVRANEAPRIFSAEAVVESDSPLRLYRACPAGLSPLAADIFDGVGALALSA